MDNYILKTPWVSEICPEVMGMSANQMREYLLSAVDDDQHNDIKYIGNVLNNTKDEKSLIILYGLCMWWFWNGRLLGQTDKQVNQPKKRPLNL